VKCREQCRAVNTMTVQRAVLSSQHDDIALQCSEEKCCQEDDSSVQCSAVQCIVVKGNQQDDSVEQCTGVQSTG
jgi:hypothetical protein